MELIIPITTAQEYAVAFDRFISFVMAVFAASSVGLLSALALAKW
jgi:hypothetical protein